MKEIDSVRNARKMQIERIRSKLACDLKPQLGSPARWSEKEIRLLLNEIDDAEIEKENFKKSRESSTEEMREFAGEFLRMSLGSLEWESLRSLARDILKRTGGQR